MRCHGCLPPQKSKNTINNLNTYSSTLLNPKSRGVYGKNSCMYVRVYMQTRGVSKVTYPYSISYSYPSCHQRIVPSCLPSLFLSLSCFAYKHIPNVKYVYICSRHSHPSCSCTLSRIKHPCIQRGRRTNTYNIVVWPPTSL